jgi:hypothetical protein
MWKSTIFLTLILFVSLVFADQVCIDRYTNLVLVDQVCIDLPAYDRKMAVILVDATILSGTICTFITCIILSCLGFEMPNRTKKRV